MMPIAQAPTSMLLTALRAAKVSPDTDFLVSPPPSPSAAINYNEQVKFKSDIERNEQVWLAACEERDNLLG